LTELKRVAVLQHLLCHWRLAPVNTIKESMNRCRPADRPTDPGSGFLYRGSKINTRDADDREDPLVHTQTADGRTDGLRARRRRPIYSQELSVSLPVIRSFVSYSSRRFTLIRVRT